MNSFELPKSVDALIDLLDTRAFPLKNFSVDTPHHVMQRELGKRDVIDFLRLLQKERDTKIEEFFDR